MPRPPALRSAAWTSRRRSPASLHKMHGRKKKKKKDRWWLEAAWCLTAEAVVSQEEGSALAPRRHLMQNLCIVIENVTC